MLIDDDYQDYLSARVSELLDDGHGDIEACRIVYVREEELITADYFDGLVYHLEDNFTVGAVFSEACQINADRVVWEGEDV